jgi:hypothetical protein
MWLQLIAFFDKQCIYIFFGYLYYFMVYIPVDVIGLNNPSSGRHIHKGKQDIF